MAHYARILDGTVVEIIAWDPAGRYPEDWIWVECPTDTRQGATYDGETFTNPELPEPEPTDPAPVYRRSVTRPEFKLLFTGPERIGIAQARQGGDTAEQKMAKAVLDDFYEIIEDPALTAIRLDHPAVQEGLDFLVGAGLITAERRTEIALGVAT